MHHFEYWHDQGNLRLELHWRPIHDQSPAALDVFAAYFTEPQAVTVAGLPLPALSLQDNILYLCGHGGNHFWFRVFWLVDLAEIIRQNSTLDWQELTDLGKSNRVTASIGFGGCPGP